MTKSGTWIKKGAAKKSIVSSSFKRLNSSLGDYLMAIKSLNNTVEGTSKSR